MGIRDRREKWISITKNKDFNLLAQVNLDRQILKERDSRAPSGYAAHLENPNACRRHPVQSCSSYNRFNAHKKQTNVHYLFARQ